MPRTVFALLVALTPFLHSCANEPSSGGGAAAAANEASTVLDFQQKWISHISSKNREFCWLNRVAPIVERSCDTHQDELTGNST